jgi:peptidoglycan/LPS O-acetylase OafA/YrhL
MISPRLSTYLDLLRFAAAMIVLLSHLAYTRFTDGAYLAIREFNLGSDAVVVFFVLSGFVIAHTAKAKDGTIGQYFFNRATRIYSVAIPAILLTFILDRNGSAFNHQAYNGWWYNPASLGEMLWMGTTFCSEWNVSVLVAKLRSGLLHLFRDCVLPARISASRLADRGDHCSWPQDPDTRAGMANGSDSLSLSQFSKRQNG